MPSSNSSPTKPRTGSGRNRPEVDRWDWVDLDPEARRARPESPDAERSARESAVEEEAYRRGFAEGVDSARGEAQAELEKALRTTMDVVEQVRSNRKTWHDREVERLAVLAAGIAFKIVGDAHEADPGLFRDLAEDAVAAFPPEEDVKIRLHPDDLRRLSIDEALSSVVDERGARWIPDEDIVRGGCVVEGPDRIVDGRLDEALRRVIQELTRD